MSLLFDPVWPWSHVWEYLTGASWAVQMLVAVGCLHLLALPFLVRRGARGRRVLRVLLGLEAGLLLLTARWAWSDGTLAELGRGLGLCLLALVPVALVSLTIAAYLGVEEATPRRISAILAIRLAAFLLVLFAVFRPSLAFTHDEKTQSTLLIAVDDSESMTVRDTFGQSRWDYLVRTLREVQPHLERLRDGERVETVVYRFSGDTRPFQLEEAGEAGGSRTDFGSMLRWLFERRDAVRPPVGLLVLSDGADNGSTYPALAEAGRWRLAPCPVHTFALGKESTSDSRNDVVVVGIAAEPLPVPVKGQLTLKVTVDAPGFKERKVRLRLFLEDEEVKAQDEMLTRSTGNVLSITCTAPGKPGDVMVRVRVEDPRRPGQPLPGEVSDRNNEKVTFVPVSREGFSVLLVDRQRAWEPVLIADALRGDPRLNLHTVWLRGDQPVDPDAGDLFQLARKQYDVVILGDVTPAQIRAINPQALDEIAARVKEGTGLLLLGGYASFTAPWRSTPLTPLLPVEIGAGEQHEEPVHMMPTEEGLRKYSYLLGLGTTADESRAEWKKLPPLDGMSVLSLPGDRSLISVLAVAENDRPMLVARRAGLGRVLAFAGDTTHRWIVTPEAARMHRRFWLQMVRWLGRQDEQEGSVWVRPDTRALPLRNDLGFTVGLRNKEGVEVKGGKLDARVITPGGETIPVRLDERPEGQRGVFAARDAQGEYRPPGVYRLEASGQGQGPDGEEITGTGTARFVIEDDEIEKSRQAADHTFLARLAAAGGGKKYLAGDLERFLAKLEGRSDAVSRLERQSWPTWRTRSASPFFVLLYLVFVAMLAGEWLLRRRWGLA